MRRTSGHAGRAAGVAVFLSFALVPGLAASFVPAFTAPAASHSAEAPPPQSDGDPPVVVASKPFAESYLLAEMFAQLLEARGIAVERRPGLGATEVAFRALVQGAIDVYPEYTGTGLIAILHETLDDTMRADPRRTNALIRELLDR